MPGDSFRLGKIRALFVLLPIILFFQIKDKLHWAPVLLFCSGIFHWAVSPLFLTDYPITIQLPASKGAMRWTLNNYPIHAIEELLIPFGCMSVTIFLSRYPKIFIAKLFVYFAVLQAVYGLLQVLDIQLFYGVVEPWFQRTPLALMGQHTVLGAFLAACLAPAIWYAMWPCAAIIAVCILFTGSSMAYASTWVVITLFVAHRFRIRHAVYMQIKLLVFVAALIVFAPKSELFNFHERWDLWAAGIRAFLENPWFGGGPGYWPGYWQPRFFPVVNNHTPDNLHAEWLKLLVEYGLFGAVIVCAGLAQFLNRFRLTWHHAICCAIIVNAMANFPLHIVPIGILFLWSLDLSMKKERFA